MNYKERYKLLNEELSKCEDKTSSLAILLVDSIKELEEKYPEVKESEDKRIMEELIKEFKELLQRGFPTWGTIKVDAIIAWLEKVGEQHLKFRIGDTIKKESTGDIVTISEIDLKNREYRLSNTGSIPFKYEHLWELVEQKPAWSEEDEYKYNTILHHLDLRKEKYKKECNQEEQDRYQCLYDWLKFLKDRVGCEVNCTTTRKWSEEDERIIKRVDSLLFSQCEIHGSEYDEIHNWLKSLKDRYTWKPSDEQMAVLNEVINYAANSELQHWSSFIYTILKSLREQLKKLKGE